MADINQETKNSIGYTASITGESTTRLIPGLSLGSSSAPNLGPNILPAVTNIYEALHRFSTGTFGNFRWVRENEVTL